MDNLYRNLDKKTTDDLVIIWVENDKDEWSQAAFSTIYKILCDREIEIPLQNDYIKKQKRFYDMRFVSIGLLGSLAIHISRILFFVRSFTPEFIINISLLGLVVVSGIGLIRMKKWGSYLYFCFAFINVIIHVYNIILSPYQLPLNLVFILFPILICLLLIGDLMQKKSEKE